MSTKPSFVYQDFYIFNEFYNIIILISKKLGKKIDKFGNNT